MRTLPKASEKKFFLYENVAEGKRKFFFSYGGPTTFPSENQQKIMKKATFEMWLLVITCFSILYKEE